MGDTVQIHCLVSKGDMPIEFSWLFNGEAVSTELSVNIAPFGKKTSVLSIDYVNESHIGNFTCVASNQAGTSKYSAELFVKGISLIFDDILNFLLIYSSITPFPYDLFLCKEMNCIQSIKLGY